MEFQIALMLVQDGITTLETHRGADGSLYLAGTDRPDKKTNLSTVFVARVSPDSKPAWMRSYTYKPDGLSTTPPAPSPLGPLELTQAACVLVIRPVNLAGTSARNILLYLNEKGEEKFQRSSGRQNRCPQVDLQRAAQLVCVVIQGANRAA